MQPFQIFIVEDDDGYSKIPAYHLSLNPHYQVTCFSSRKEVLSTLYKKPGLINLNFSMPKFRGDKFEIARSTIYKMIQLKEIAVC